MLTAAGLLQTVRAQPAQHDAMKRRYFTRKPPHSTLGTRHAWQANWLHDANLPGCVVYREQLIHLHERLGDEITQRVARSIKASPKLMRAEIVNTNFIIRQEAGLAWVE